MANYDLSTSATELRINTQGTGWSTCLPVDSAHVLLVGANSAVTGNVSAEIIAVNTSTYAISTVGSEFAYYGGTGSGVSDVCQIDSTHFLLCGSLVSNSDMAAVVLAVDTSTWGITTAGSRLDSISAWGDGANVVSIDSTHYLLSWSETGGGGSYGQTTHTVLTVNTSTWAVTTATTNFASSGTSTFSYPMGMQKVDDNHFLHFFNGTSNDGYAQVIAVNTSTWAVSTAGAAFTGWDTGNISHPFQVDKDNTIKIDSTHVIFVWNSYTSAFYTQVFSVNTSTWAVTTAGSRKEINDGTKSGYIGTAEIFDLGDSHYIIGASYFASGPNNSSAYNVVAVNTSTWAITTSTTPLITNTDPTGFIAMAPVGDGNHFLTFEAVNSNLGQDANVIAVVNPYTPPSSGASSLFTLGF